MLPCHAHAQSKLSLYSDGSIITGTIQYRGMRAMFINNMCFVLLEVMCFVVTNVCISVCQFIYT